MFRVHILEPRTPFGSLRAFDNPPSNAPFTFPFTFYPFPPPFRYSLLAVVVVMSVGILVTLLTGRRNWAKPSKKLVHKLVWALIRCDSNNNDNNAVQGSSVGEEWAREQQQQPPPPRDENLNLAMVEEAVASGTSDRHDQVTKF